MIKKDIPFEELEIGSEAMEPMEVELTPELVQWYAHAIESPNDDWYRYSSPLGYPIVPPAVVENLALSRSYRVSASGGSVHAWSEVQHIKPVKVGTTIRTKSIVTDKYERRGKFYDVWVVTVRDESGDEVMVAKYSEAALPEGQKVRYS